MDVVSGVVVYVLLWWLVFFMVLPIGVQSPEPSNVEKGHASGAPIRPLLLKKVASATVIAGLLWLGVYAVVVSDIYSFRDAVRGW